MKLLRKLLIKLGLWTVLAGEPYNFLGCRVHRDWPHIERRRRQLLEEAFSPANSITMWPPYKVNYVFVDAPARAKITNRVKYSGLVPVIA